MMGLLNKAKKYVASNHAGLDILSRPTAVVTKRKFEADELKIAELTLTPRVQHRRGLSGSSPTVHAAISIIAYKVVKRMSLDLARPNETSYVHGPHANAYSI